MEATIKQPATLDEAVQILLDNNKESLNRIREMTENRFLASTHHFLGQNLRNSWYLWWYENHTYTESWPMEKPALVAQFNTMGVYHADDMSSIILTCFHRHVTGKDYLVDDQVAHIKDFWARKENGGFAGGIFKRD